MTAKHLLDLKFELVIVDELSDRYAYFVKYLSGDLSLTTEILESISIPSFINNEIEVFALDNKALTNEQIITLINVFSNED